MALAQKSAESGNIFFAIFGAVALLGILAAGTMTFIKGPLATSVKLNRQNVAENQMMIAGQVAVMSAASQPNSGDCDSDAYVEPLEWRDAGALPKPTGGGLVPSSIGIAKKDPWGTEYGYCGWDHGPQINGGGTCGGAGQKRLAGGNTNSVPVVALISAGPDKVFTTTCRTYAAADVNSDGDLLDATDLTLVSKAALTDDDVIFSYTYQEATAASGGLWSLKSGDSGTAVINKNIEATGTANLQGGIMLADKALITCDATTAGVMAMNGNAIEICDGAGAWTAITGGGGALGTTATCAAPADAGNIRYNTGTGQPEFCNGTIWVPFTLSSQVANLVFTPMQYNAMNVDGGNNLDTTNCTVPSGYSCGAIYTFTLQNQGGAASTSISVSMTNVTNFVKVSDTCNGNTLGIGASCTIGLRPKANGNTSFSGVINITAENNPFATMQGVATNFGCFPGRLGPGGIYAGCGLPDPDGSFDLVINPGGCSGAVTNPSCTFGNDTGAVSRMFGGSGVVFPYVVDRTGAWGARQHQNLVAYSTMSSTVLSAVQYCNDMVYGGYSDWFLPSRTEWDYVQAAFNAGQIPFVYGAYKLSDSYEYYGLGNMSQEWVSAPGAPYYRGDWRTSAQPVRCVRRENLPLPAAVADTDPDTVSIPPVVVTSASAPGTSIPVTLSGFLQPVTATISGGSGMDIIKNGTPQGSTSVAGLKVGDTLSFRMNAPAVLGTKSNATVTIGTDTYTWWVGYADTSRTVKVFVAPGTYGSKGGLPGADAWCNSQAAASSLGLSGNWKAILSSSSINAADRIPWNWGTAQAVNGSTIVDGGLPDMFDGALDAPLNIKADGTAYNGFVHTGSSAYGVSFNQRGTAAFYWCNDWTSNAYYGAGGTVGNAASASQAFYYDSGDAYWCSGDPGPLGVYCMEDIDSASDTLPSQIVVPYKIQVAVSTRTSSDPIVIGGMSPAATQTLSVSATGGTPTFTINGGGEVASGSVSNGDTIVFKMTSAATASTSQKMTITAGSMTAYWRVWTGDPTGSATKRAFVTNANYAGNLGGLAGADAKCQSQAATAGLGGTWKALLSDPADENNWAINRIGYNWSTLELVDGTDVATAGQIWSPPLLSPLNKSQSGAVLSSTSTYSNTLANGRPYSTNPASACGSWTTGSNDYDQTWGVVGATTSQWVAGGNVTGCYPCSDGCYRLTCIEQ